MSREDFAKQALYMLLKAEGLLFTNLRSGCLQLMNAGIWENRIRGHRNTPEGKVAILQLCFYLNTAEKGAAIGSGFENFFLSGEFQSEYKAVCGGLSSLVAPPVRPAN